MYGLFSTQTNRFYYVSDDHDLLKHVQLSLISQKLLLLVDINSVSRGSIITPTNCSEIGLTDGELIKLQVDSEFFGEANTVTRSKRMDEQEKQVFANVQDLTAIMSVYLRHKKEIHSYINTKTQHAIKGLESFKYIMSPTFADPSFMRELIDAEIQDLRSVTDHHDSGFSDICGIVSQVPITETDWKNKVIDRIMSMPDKNRHWPNFKQKLQ